MSKHTPGPWNVGRPGKVDPTYPHWIISDTHPIATVCGYAGEEGQAANAKLLAAAPELLAVCQGVLSHPSFKACDCGEPDCATTVLRAAIAKATT